MSVHSTVVDQLYAELREENVQLRAALTELHHQAQRLWDAECGASLFEQAVEVWSDLIDAIEAAAPLVKTDGRDS